MSYLDTLQVSKSEKLYLKNCLESIKKNTTDIRIAFKDADDNYRKHVREIGKYFDLVQNYDSFNFGDSTLVFGNDLKLDYSSDILRKYKSYKLIRSYTPIKCKYSNVYHSHYVSNINDKNAYSNLMLINHNTKNKLNKYCLKNIYSYIGYKQYCIVPNSISQSIAMQNDIEKYVGRYHFSKYLKTKKKLLDKGVYSAIESIANKLYNSGNLISFVNHLEDGFH